MTEKDLDALESLAKAATPGPTDWRGTMDLLAEATAKGHPCDNCELHCEYEGESMRSCLLKRIAYPNKW